MTKKIQVVLVIALLCSLVFTVTCYAITDADVQSAVDASSKESVSGNLFIWFLCAIAFMKVSQKIDSFMGSLGISVGRTGGSMMAEAMIVARTVGSAVKSGGFSGFGKGGRSSGTESRSPAGGGGMFGGIGRKMSEGAADMAAGKKTSGGLMANIGKKVYEGSVEKGGSFATSVIGSVARGEISKMGTITGSNGKAAMESYFGYNANLNKSGSQTADINQNSKNTFEHGGATSMTAKNEVEGMIGFDSSGMPMGGSEKFDTDVSMNGGSVPEWGAALSENAGNIPVFSEIEMGGGRISGIEATHDYPDGRQFVMYDAEKYAKPEGNFETITAVDNSKWYKQYAQPAVERIPYMDNEGKVQYNEKIVDRMPRAPMQKDKM